MFPTGHEQQCQSRHETPVFFGAVVAPAQSVSVQAPACDAVCPWASVDALLAFVFVALKCHGFLPVWEEEAKKVFLLRLSWHAYALMKSSNQMVMHVMSHEEEVVWLGRFSLHRHAVSCM